MTDILQTICPECGHEVYRKANDDDYIYCPDCRTELERNEMSSEDADDGVFTEPTKCTKCGCVLSAVTSSPALLCRECFNLVVDKQIEARRQERKERRKSRESDDDMHGVNPS